MVEYKQKLMFRRLQLIFSVFMALYPILCLYKGFYRFTIGDLGLMFFMLLGLLNLPRIDSRFGITIVFLVYTVMVFVVNLMIAQTMQISAFSSYLFRLIKLFFYLICAFTCGRTFFNTEYFQKAIIKVSVILCLFLFFQYIAYYGMNQLFLGRLPGLELYLENYAEMDYEQIYLFGFRPCSFFLEPAQFSQYMAVPLTLTLFSRNMTKMKKILLVLLFVAGMLLSTSAQGVFYLIVISGMYGLFVIRKKGVMLAFFVGVTIVGVIAYLNIDAARFAVDRLLFGADALEERVGTYKYIAEMSGLHLLFGYGYGVLPIDKYFAGAPYVWYGCGFVGFLLVLGMFFSMYRNALSVKGKVLCVVFLVAFFITCLFYNYMLFWYFALILSTRNQSRSLAGDFDAKEEI